MQRLRLPPQKVRQKRKLDEQVSDALEKITNRMTLNANPKNEYVASFCNSIHQEMFKMPDDVMEDVKDDVFALLVQAIKKKKHVKLEVHSNMYLSVKGKNTPVVRAKLRRLLSTNCGQTNQ
jgi:ABC-type proline/glycine betaine transport system ATPase subunit